MRCARRSGRANPNQKCALAVIFSAHRKNVPVPELQFGCHGPSLTVGMRGAHVTVGGSGIRKTVGIPGTGIYYTSHSGYHSGAHSAHVEQPISDSQQTTAHSIAQIIALMLIIGTIAFGIALVGTIAGGK